MVDFIIDMRVLSLFDGISCARVALERMGVKVEAYYASEIDTNAIEVSKQNWPDIIQVGDVKKLDGKTILGGGCIDLLIGGSPCQDLSKAKWGRQGLKGPRSSLFYEYLRILKEIRPRYFVLENVASMSKEARDEISKCLGVESIMIDAALVSAQIRRRYFWTNIPGVCQPWDRGILLAHVAESKNAVMLTERRTEEAKRIRREHKKKTGKDFTPRRARELITRLDGKANTITTGRTRESLVLVADTIPDGLFARLPDGRVVVREATKKGWAVVEEGDSIDFSFPNSTTRRGRVGKKAKNLMTTSHISVFKDGIIRPLTPLECERLQSLPDGYTEGRSTNKRIETLGNAFNVEVVRHILSHARI